jgi:hypothetical protein
VLRAARPASAHEATRRPSQAARRPTSLVCLEMQRASSSVGPSLFGTHSAFRTHSGDAEQLPQQGSPDSAHAADESAAPRTAAQGPGGRAKGAGREGGGGARVEGALGG